MRIVAIGLGGAGCRIVDSLYTTDRHSSKVACIQGLAVDVDETTLRQLEGLPEPSKIFFPSLDPDRHETSGGAGPTATIDIGEIVSRIHNFESGETDAIFICCGLGGSMTDIVPHVITSLRASIVEPIFGLVTLPCLAEGEKRSAKASDDIDILSPLLDGMILFDNETWYKKIKARSTHLRKKEAGIARRFGFGKAEPEISSELATYLLLNETIVRRISLILRAGEFRADGGIDLAEVVLDSGEVLNTIKGMGFITIGYAVERLSPNPLGFLTQWKPAGIFNEESKKKASRIVELAKQAIYHEISTPCDMTSAHKALILVAGPSHELSMKGYMTVRKWIDRSIRGLETRSGDYPVMNTKNVAIIIMLSGLENIPRISELREIRAQYSARSRHGDIRSAPAEKGAPGQDADPKTGRGKISPSIRSAGNGKDEMIILPTKMKQERYSYDSPDDAGNPGHGRETGEYGGLRGIVPETDSSLPQASLRPTSGTSQRKEELLSQKVAGEKIYHVTDDRPRVIKRRVIVTPGKDNTPGNDPRDQRIRESSSMSSHLPKKETGKIISYGPDEGREARPVSDSAARTKDIARHRIEQELQRQRMIAISGKAAKPDNANSEPDRTTPGTSGSTREIPNATVSSEKPRSLEMEKKTIILQKRKTVLHSQENLVPDTPVHESAATDERIPEGVSGNSVPEEAPDKMTVDLKEPGFRVKDEIFDGKKIQRSAIPKVRDTSLMHTSLKQKRPDRSAKSPDADTVRTAEGEAVSEPQKKEGKNIKT